MVFPIAIFLEHRLPEDEDAGTGERSRPLLDRLPLSVLEKLRAGLIGFVALRAGIGDEKGDATDRELVPGPARIYAALECFVEIERRGAEFAGDLVEACLPELDLFFRIVVPEFVVVAHEQIRSSLQRLQKFSVAPVLEITPGQNRQRIVCR